MTWEEAGPIPYPSDPSHRQSPRKAEGQHQTRPISLVEVLAGTQDAQVALLLV